MRMIYQRTKEVSFKYEFRIDNSFDSENLNHNQLILKYRQSFGTIAYNFFKAVK